MRSSILGIYHPGGVFHPSATNTGQFGRITDRSKGTPAYELNGQFGKLTDRTEGTPVPELAEGGASVCGVPSLAFNIHRFHAFTENDRRWFLSPEGVK